jgi:hypothetical protein
MGTIGNDMILRIPSGQIIGGDELLVASCIGVGWGVVSPIGNDLYRLTGMGWAHSVSLYAYRAF